MNINYAESFNFKPIPAITPLDRYWENGTWKFNMSEISAGATYQPSWIDIILSGNTALTLINAKEDGLNYLKLFGGTELVPETYIDSVTAEGKCEQRNLPSGYTQVEYIESSGTQYLDLGKISSSDIIDMKVEWTQISNSYLLGSLEYGSNWLDGKLLGITYYDANKTFYSRGTTTSTSGGHATYFTPTANVVNTIRWQPSSNQLTFNGTTYTGASGNNSQTTDVFETANDVYLFAANRGGTAGSFDYAKMYRFSIKGKMNLIPARRNSDNVLGMYDTVSGNFLTNQGTGTFTAGSDVTSPSPDYPMDIVCNNGTIKAKMASGLPLGYTKVEYLQSSGTQYIITKAIKANQTVKCKMALNAAVQTGWMGAIDAVNSLVRFGITNNIIYCQRPTTGAFGIAADTDFHTFIATPTKLYIDNNSDTINVTTDMTTPFALFAQNDGRTSNVSSYLSCKISEFEITEGSTLVQKLIPCKRNSDNVLGMYDLVSNTFLTNAGTGTFTAGADDDSLQIYADGTVETITDNQGNVATCQNLLSVGNYKDTQEILSGAVSRNVGIKVLDGTENWGASAVSNVYYLEINGMRNFGANSDLITCSHYVATDATTATMTNGTIKIAYITASADYGAIFVKDTNIADLTAWTTYLATQYANGTPVIVTFPLATATSETVTGQVLNKTPLTYSGSVSGLTGTVVTSSHSVPSPTQPLQINCNNGVVKYSRNLFDISKSTLGGISSQNGQPFDNNKRTRTDFIAFNSNSISISIDSSDDYAIVNTYFYDASKNFLGTITPTHSGADQVFTTNIMSGAKYVCVTFCGLSSEFNITLDDFKNSKIQIEEGSTVTPYVPYVEGGIYTDGTTEKVEVHSKNLFDKATVTVLDAYIENNAVGSTASVVSSIGNKCIVPSFKVKPNTTYTITRVIPSSNYERLRVLGCTTLPTIGTSGVMLNKVNDATTKTLTFTTQSDTQYICINVNQSDVSSTWQTYLDGFMIEQGSTATTYEAYYYGGSALAEMLLAVGDYEDEQSVLDGSVTRNVGIKVLDGTENWGMDGTPKRAYLEFPQCKSEGNATLTVGYCSHFTEVETWNPSLPSGFALYTGSLGGSVYLHMSGKQVGTTDVTEFKQWLSDQYNSGNPVIVIYPLATATTETVTGQELTIQEGTNIVEITEASIDNLPLEVSYKAGVTVTITEVENAQLDNNVEVTIQ